MLDFGTPRVCCEGAPLADLAAQFGTPLYVYSRSRLQHNYARLAGAFAPLRGQIRYAVKANGNLALLRLLRGWGAGFDVVSGGEVHRCLRAGADPASIVFAGAGKTEAELRLAVEAGLGWINVEAIEEARTLEAIAAARAVRPRVALRLNPDVEAETHPHIATGGRRSKFGLDAEDADRLLADRARFPHLDLAGVHVHVGSQLAAPDATVAAARLALDLAERHGLRMIDVGGGFPVAYTSEADPDSTPDPAAFARALAPLLAGRDLELLVEPGRSIVADAGLLLARVLNVKRRAGRQVVVVDAGMNDLIRPALYAAHHPIAPVDVVRGETMPSDVVGPVCESADAFARDRRLPPLRRGDLLAITHAGAYGMSMASNYNARPRPAEVLVDGATATRIRRRETLDDLVAAEIDPPND